MFQLYNKALKDFKGGVLQLSSLVSSPAPVPVKGSSVLRASSAPPPALPASSLLSSHLAESSLPAKLLERNYYGHGDLSLRPDQPGLQLEYVAGAGLPLTGLATLGVVEVEMFSDVSSWVQVASVWSRNHHDTRLVSLLTYLEHSSQCLVMEDRERQVLVLFPHSSFTGIIGILDQLESHFYHKQMSNTFSLPLITNNQEIQSILEKIKPPKFSPCKKSGTRHIERMPKWDPTSLESWRFPDRAEKNFVNTLKSFEKMETSQQSEYFKLMMSVRDSYTARPGIVAEPGRGEGKKFDRKASALSNASTVTVSSGSREGGTRTRKSLSRGEMLRNMSGVNRTCPVADSEDLNKKDATEAVLLAEKETLIQAKTESASEFEENIGDHGTNTESLISTLTEILRQITKDPEDVVLAGYSEACISVLLKHLDTSGVSKSSLEDVVTSKLLLDPASVARLAGEDTSLRAAHHKVQVLLRAEVHWLLASQVRDNIQDTFCQFDSFDCCIVVRRDRRSMRRRCWLTSAR